MDWVLIVYAVGSALVFVALGLFYLYSMLRHSKKEDWGVNLVLVGFALMVFLGAVVMVVGLF